MRMQLRLAAAPFIVAVSLAAQLAAPRGQAPGQPQGRDSALAQALSGFLNQWLVAHNTVQATAQYLSPIFSDERFVPVVENASGDGQRFTPQWMGAAHPISPAQFQSRMALYLTEVGRAVAQGPIDTVVQPFTLEDARRLDESLGKILTQHDARQLPGFRGLAYRVRGWRDLEWTASGTTGYRTSLSALIDQQRLDVEAVVSRVRPAAPDNEPLLLVMIWVSRDVPVDWRLVGVEAPPTR